MSDPLAITLVTPTPESITVVGGKGLTPTVTTGQTVAVVTTPGAPVALATTAPTPAAASVAISPGIKPVFDHSWAVNGVLANEALPGISIYLTGEEAKEIVAVTFKFENGAGTIKAALMQSGAEVGKWTVTKTLTRENVVSALKDKDYLKLVLSGLTGEGNEKLSFSVHIRQTR